MVGRRLPSAFKGVLPGGGLRQFLSHDMVGSVVARLLSEHKDGWKGTASCMDSECVEGRSSMGFRVLRKQQRHLVHVPMDPNANWMEAKLK